MTEQHTSYGTENLTVEYIGDIYLAVRKYMSSLIYHGWITWQRLFLFLVICDKLYRVTWYQEQILPRLL